MSLEDIAIARIREFVPEEGYYMAHSGGKDSVVAEHLLRLAGAKYDSHYQVVGVDPPELGQFLKAHYPNVIWEMPSESIFRAVMRKGLPLRTARWCCEILKEGGGDGRRVITGLRWQESGPRKSRRWIEACYRNSGKIFINPIIDWTMADVWTHIRKYELPYCPLYDEGFKRIGCILCPSHSAQMKQAEIARWPKIANAWKRAAIRYWERQTPGGKRFPSGEAFFDWWVSNKPVPYD